ncbi:MAG: HlyD family efflux transporter periplasmic adaptor subunit [Eubacteriales bacterium]|nr:HlyD family efflux transporter periplasmic adaptor subunit [Eubacteriales bacterium]
MLILVVAAAALVVLNMRSQLNSSYQQDVAARRDLSTYLSFDGHLSPVTDETQTAKESLKVKELYVSEGDTVKKGDAILRGADGTRVLAAYSGTLETLYPGVDDTLQPGSQIARIVDYDTLEVSVDVDEYDIGAVAVGRTGDVYLNALERTVTGEVSEVARDATSDGGVRYYEVKLRFDAAQAGDDVRSGMSVEVQMLDKQALGCVSIATKALSYDDLNRPYVLVRDAQDQMKTQYVTLGVSDGLNTEITEGVSDGQSVYYLDNDMMRFFAMRSSMMSMNSGK